MIFINVTIRDTLYRKNSELSQFGNREKRERALRREYEEHEIYSNMLQHKSKKCSWRHRKTNYISSKALCSKNHSTYPFI